MLRILSSSQLEGYVIKGRGGPPWELLAGTVAKIQQDGEALLVCISGSNIENGMIKTRTAKVVFVDDKNSISRVTNYEKHGNLFDIMKEEPQDL